MSKFCVENRQHQLTGCTCEQLETYSDLSNRLARLEKAYGILKDAVQADLIRPINSGCGLSMALAEAERVLGDRCDHGRHFTEVCIACCQDIERKGK
jgi:hypothetical protein